MNEWSDLLSCMLQLGESERKVQDAVEQEVRIGHSKSLGQQLASGEGIKLLSDDTDHPNVLADGQFFLSFSPSISSPLSIGCPFQAMRICMEEELSTVTTMLDIWSSPNQLSRVFTFMMG